MAGGGENNEQAIDAAIREIKEEINVSAISVISLTSMAYIPSNVISERHRQFWSADTYVIPEYTFAFECDKEICLSNEHVGFEWLSYEDAISKLTWDSNKTALFELNCRLCAE